MTGDDDFDLVGRAGPYLDVYPSYWPDDRADAVPPPQADDIFASPDGFLTPPAALAAPEELSRPVDYSGCKTPEEVVLRSGALERFAEAKRRAAAGAAAPVPALGAGPARNAVAVAPGAVAFTPVGGTPVAGPVRPFPLAGAPGFDSNGLPELSPEALAQINAVCPPKRHASHKPVAVGQIPKPLPEKDNPSALFKNGWLRKGGGAFLIAPSGVGKSTISMQAAFMFALGREFFGITPVRQLNVMIVQAEDDRDEFAYFRDCIVHGLITDFGVDAQDLNFVLGTEDEKTARVRTYKIVGKVGQEFVEELGALMDDYPEIDLFIINPFQSYFGADCSKNVEISQFLRVWLDKEIKDPTDEGRDRAAVLFVHHTNKPPSKNDDRELWGVDQFAAYIGAGGAEMVNWARAILSLMPTKIEGVYRLCAGKRGQRLGWIDMSTGKKTRCKIIKHAEDELVYWRPCDDADIAELGEAEQAKGRAGARGAVGGDGSGGKPAPKEAKYKPITAVSCVVTSPEKSGRWYREKIMESTKPPCSDATALRLLREAVTLGWLSCTSVNHCNRYTVTEEGRHELGDLGF